MSLVPHPIPNASGHHLHPHFTNVTLLNAFLLPQLRGGRKRWSFPGFVYMITFRWGFQLVVGRCWASGNMILDFPGLSDIFQTPELGRVIHTADCPHVSHLSLSLFSFPSPSSSTLFLLCTGFCCCCVVCLFPFCFVFKFYL